MWVMIIRLENGTVTHDDLGCQKSQGLAKMLSTSTILLLVTTDDDPWTNQNCFQILHTYTDIHQCTNYIIKCVSIHIWNLGMLQRGYPKNCSIRDPFRPKKLSMFVISFVPENFEYPDIQIFRILLSISGLFDSTR